MNLQELIARKAELVQLTTQLDEYAMDLLRKKRENLDIIDAITKDNIEPLKLENSEIDTELERIMKETGMKSITCDTYGVYEKAQTSVKVHDTAKVLSFASKYPQVLKKDILKVSELDNLEEQGIVPIPEEDGFEISTTKIFQYRKK